MKALSELLAMAQQHAELTGDGALLLAPGVTAAEAHVAAWHAIGVQGGASSPQREAWRLACDKGEATIFQATNANYTEGPVDTELVGRCIGTTNVAAGLAAALERTQPAPLHYPEGTQPMGSNDRGEFTDAAGKLFHQVSVPQAADFAVHEGAWISCDGCNPVVVVNPRAFGGKQQERLEALRAEYARSKAAKDAATEEFDVAKDKLQAALSEASGGALRSTLVVTGYKPVTLTYTEPWRVDSKALKAEQPEIYVRYAKQGTQWTLAESRSKS